MDDPAESDAAPSAPEPVPPRPVGDATPASGDGLGFRLRIGATDRPRIGALSGDAARGATGETPVTSPPAADPAGAGTDPETPITGDPPVNRGDDWDAIPAAVRHDDVREYRTDAEVQRSISDLANKIAMSDASPAVAAPAARGTAPADPARPRGGTAIAPSTVRVGAAVASAAVVSPVPEPGVLEPALVAPAHVPPARSEPPVAEVPVAAPPAVDPPAVDPPAAAAPVALPDIVEATPAGDVVTGQHPVVPAVLPAVGTPAPSPGAGPTLASVAVAPPVLPAAQLLPKIEARPGAGRPTKPVDFRSLLGDAGMPSSTAKRKKQRHPVRFLVKLVLLVGLLGGGAYAAKRYYLDSQWADDIEGIAEDVAERRGLEWDHAVEVVALERNDYALRLASVTLGVDIAQAATLGGEWRAMGLAEGSLDLVAVGSGAMADRPAFYDPTDDRIYEVSDLSPGLREIALSRALTSALLDQHVHWSTRIAAASPSVRLGLLALVDGDAVAIRAGTVGSVLADEQSGAEATAELAALRLESAPLASGAPPYAVAVTGLLGSVTAPLFGDDLAATTVARDALFDLDVASDAALVDGARGRAAEVVLPEQATTTVAATSGSAAGSGPDATASAGVLGAASGAASQTEEAIAQTVGAIEESTGTTVDPAAGSVPAEATVPVTTGAPVASADATTRGLVYWYYVLAGRLDPGRAWTAALQWQGDLTSVAVSADGLCVSSIVTTEAGAGHDLLLAALGEWAAGAPAAARTAVSSATATEIVVSSCDPGPAADTYANADVAPFGNADEEQIVAAGLVAEGLPRSEAARACVFRAVREIGLPALLESKTLDRSLSERTIDPTAPEVDALIARCGNE